MTLVRRVVVVGGGAAGLTVLRTLREEGYAGELALIGEEPALPYDRPPLSKQALVRDASLAPALISEQQMDALACVVQRGERAVHVDADARVVTTASGKKMSYDVLVAATGVRARVPRWAAGLAGAHVLRSASDARGLATAMDGALSMLVIGAGFLGTEVAAAARQRGLAVTLVDLQSQPMLMQLGTLAAQRVAGLHRERGVAVRCGCSVSRLIVEDGRAVGAVLSDGMACRADVVMIALGCDPAVEWLQGSGVDLDDGLVCDAYCRAAPGIYGAGDVASFPSARYGKRLRLEHRMNATEQGIAVARNILGAEERYDPVPFFWSDQYDAKMQLHGLVERDACARMLAGEPSGLSFVVGYCGSRDELRGVLGWNSPREARKWRAKLGDRLDLSQTAAL